MSTAEEATINPDGSTTFENEPPPMNNDTAGEDGSTFDSMPPEETGIDPAFYLLGAFILFVILYFVITNMRKKDDNAGDDFFASLDTEKVSLHLVRHSSLHGCRMTNVDSHTLIILLLVQFNLKLPSEVDEYYKIKEKCEEAGWEPGSVPASPQEAANGPHRIMAQALMKRAIADIPILQHIQKESPGMNKLYAQSMCSEKQWRAYQKAEALVSAEVEEVRREADQVEPGWSQMIWRQAMQYHQMLKQRHEQEAKAAEAAAAAAKPPEKKKTPEELIKEKEQAAEKAAQELLKQEEKEKQKDKAFSGGTKLKKGFLEANTKPKKK